MNNMTESYSLKPGVYVLPTLDGGARILDLGDRFYSINNPAYQLLQIALRDDPLMHLSRLADDQHRAWAEVHAEYTDCVKALCEKKVIVRAGTMQASDFWGRAGGVTELLFRPVAAMVGFFGPRPPVAWVLLALANVSFRMLGWANTIELWRRAFPLRSRTIRTDRKSGIAKQIHESICRSASGHLFPVACKERALCCWVLLRTAGMPCEFVVGATPLPVTSHAWCVCDGQILSDFADHCDRFRPVATYV